MSRKYAGGMGPLQSAWNKAAQIREDEEILARANAAGKDSSDTAVTAALRRAKAEREKTKTGHERITDVPEAKSSAEKIVGAAQKFILGECDTIDAIDADTDVLSKWGKYNAAAGAAAGRIRRYRDIINRSRSTIGSDTASALEGSLTELETAYREKMQSVSYPEGYLNVVESGGKDPTLAIKENPALSFFEKHGLAGNGTGSEEVVRASAAREREALAAKIPELGQKAHILKNDRSAKEEVIGAQMALKNYDSLLSAYENVDRARDAAARGDTGWLMDNGYIDMSSAEIEERVGEIEAEITELEGQLDMTPEEIERAGAAGALGFSAVNHEAEARRSEVREKISELKRTLDSYRARYYNTENKEKLASVKEDSALGETYAAAQDAAEDAAVADSLLRDYYTSSLGLTYDDERQKYLYDKYGVAIPEVLDESALISYATALNELRGKLRGDTSAAADKLSEGGYNYERMAEYERRAAQDAVNEKMAADSAAYAKEHPLAASAQQILTKPVEMIEGAGMILGNIGNGNKNAALSDYVPLYAGDMQTKIQNEAFNAGAKEALTDFTVERLGMKRDVASAVTGFLYDCGISTVDSAVRASLFGPASLVFAGGNAAADAAKTVADAGGSYGQMISMGVLSGAAEVVFEKVSLDRLLDDSSPHTISRMLKNAAAQSGVEASEEAFTEIANIIANTAVMAESSDFALAVAEYEDNGYTRGAAQRQAFFDALGQVGLSALAGAVSGAPTSILHGSANLIRNKIGDVQVLSYAKDNAAPDGAAKAIYNEIESGALEINDDSMTKLREALSDEIRATAEAERVRAADKERAAADVQAATEAARAAVEPETIETGYSLPNKRVTQIEYENEDLPQVNPELHESLSIVNEKSSDTSIPESGENVKPYYEENGRGEVWNSAVANNEAIIAGKPELAEVYYNIAKAFNVGIEFYDADPEVEGDGFYSGGVIHLNASARDPLGYVFAHELAHHTESAGTYGRLRRMALRELSQSEDVSVDELRREVAEEYHGHGVELDARGADAELVARYVQNYLLADESSVQALVSEDVSFARQVLDFVEEFLSRFTPVGNEAQRIERGRRMLRAALERAGDGSENVRFSTGKTFSEQVDDVINGKHNARYDLYVSQTPNYLQGLNFPASPMLMRNSKIGEILNKHPEMSVEVLKKLPEALENPVLVLKSKTHPNESVVVITDINTAKGEMIVPVWINQEGNYVDVNLGDVVLSTNFAASAYGRNTSNLIKYAVDNDGVLYQNDDTEKVRQLLARNGLQLPTPLKLSDSDITISQSDQSVNSSIPQNGGNDTRYQYRTTAEEYDRPITPHDVEVMHSVGRKSVNDFTGEDIQKTQKWAHKFYRELGVKSPFFRAWFGDWRASDTSEVKIIDTEGDLRSPSERNNDTGWNIIVSRQVAKETTHHSSDKVKNAVKYLPYIKDITRNAVLLDTYTSGKDNPLSLFFHSMYAYTEAMGYPALVKLKVEELINEKDGSSIRRDYILQNIEEEPISEVERFSKALHHENGSSMYSVSELYSLVKQFDKDFTPAHEVPSVLLNGDGTPKVVYHGTRDSFTEFLLQDNPKFGRALGNGFFFTSDYDMAFKFANGIFSRGQDRGGIIMPVYLRMENPYIIEPDADRARWKHDYAKGDYDGIIDLKNNTYYVESPTQIKSATDNIGTFDGSNADIRYSFSRNSDESRQSEAGEENQVPQDDEAWEAEAREVRAPEWAGQMDAAEYADKTGGNYIDGDGYLTEGHGTYREDATDTVRASGAVDEEETRRAALDKLRRERRVMTAEELRRRDADLLADEVVDTLDDILGDGMTDGIADAVYGLSDDVADGKLDADGTERAGADGDADDAAARDVLGADEFDYLMREYRGRTDDTAASEAEELRFAHLREEADKRAAVRRENEATAADFEVQRREMEAAMEEARRTADAEYERERAEYEGTAVSEAYVTEIREAVAREAAAAEDKVAAEVEAAAAKKRGEAGVTEEIRNLSEDERTTLEDVMDRLHDKIEESGISDDVLSEIRERAYGILDNSDEIMQAAMERRARRAAIDREIESAKYGIEQAESGLEWANGDGGDKWIRELDEGGESDEENRTKRRAELERQRGEFEFKKKNCEDAIDKLTKEREALREYPSKLERLIVENPTLVEDLAFEFSSASRLAHALGVASDEISADDKSRLATVNRTVARMESKMSGEDIERARTLADGGYIEARTDKVLSLAGYYSLRREILSEYAPTSFDALGIAVDAPITDGLARAAAFRANANLIRSYRAAADKVRQTLKKEGRRDLIEIAYKISVGEATTDAIPSDIDGTARMRVIRLANALMMQDGTRDLIRQNRARAANEFEAEILSDISAADTDHVGVRDISAMRLNINTPERALRTALPEKVADVIVDRVIHPLTENNRRRDRKINELIGGLSDIIGRANAEESAIIQLLNEGGLGIASLDRVRTGDAAEYTAKADAIEAEVIHREAVARAMKLGIMEEIEAGSEEALGKLRESIEDEIYTRLRRMADAEIREAARLTKLGQWKRSVAKKVLKAESRAAATDEELHREAARDADELVQKYSRSIKTYTPGEYRKAKRNDTPSLRQEARAARATAEAITRMGEYLDRESASIKKEGTREAWRHNRMEALLRAADYERSVYEKLWDALNDALVTHGYEPIGYIENYAPHTTETREDIKAELLRQLGFVSEVEELPSNLAGLTAGLRPGKQWSPYLLERRNITGEGVKLDGVGGFESYLRSVLGIIYHMDDIQKLRSLERVFREEYSPAELRERIRDIRDDVKYGRESAEDGERRIDALREKDTLTQNAGRLATWLQDYANKLANKQVFADRAMEHLLGRQTLNLGARLQNLFASSAILYNVRSALTNSVGVVSGYALAGNRATVRAVRDMFSGELNEMYGFDEKSRFLAGKRGIDTALERTVLGKIDRAGGALFEAVDDVATRIVQRALFYKLTDAGMDVDTAIDRSDTMTAALIGDRASGTKPMLFESRNFAVKLFTMFQLEATNIVAVAVEDMPRYYRNIAKTQGKKKAVRELVAVIMRYLLGAFAFNRLFYEIAGATPAPFDIVGYVLDAFGAAYGYDGADLVKRITDDLTEKVFDERLFGTDSEKELKPDAKAGAGSLLQSVLEDIPMAQNVIAMAGIGEARYPVPQISSKLWNPKSAAQFGEGALDTLLGIVPGGSQIKKTVKGVAEVALGRSVNTGSGRTKYTVDRTPYNFMRAALFGPSALGENKEYWAGDGGTLSESDNRAIKDMMAQGMSAAEANEAISKIKTAGIGDREEAEEYAYTGDALGDIKNQLYSEETASAADESASEKKLAVLRGLELSPAAEAAVWYNKIASKKQRVVYDSVVSAGADSEEVYRTVSAIATAAGSDKTRKQLELLDGSGLDGEGKAAIFYGMLAGRGEREIFDTLRDKCKESSADIAELMIDEKRARVTKFQPGEHKRSEAQLKALKDSGLSDKSKAVYYYEALASDNVRSVMDELEQNGADLGRCWEVLGEIRAADTAGEKAGILLRADLSDDEKEAVLVDVITSGEDRADLKGDLEALKDAGGSVDSWLAAKEALSGVAGKLNSKGETISGTLKKNKRRAIKDALDGEDSSVIREVYDIFGVADAVSKKKTKKSDPYGLDLGLGIDTGLDLDLGIDTGLNLGLR